MSRERELLQRILDTDPKFLGGRFIAEIQELLATPSSTKLQDRIKDYLSMGGLFNPELVNHDTVRDLILDARAEPPKREPIDTRRITLKMFSESVDMQYKNGYVDGIRFAEKAHGITGVDDETV